MTKTVADTKSGGHTGDTRLDGVPSALPGDNVMAEPEGRPAVAAPKQARAWYTVLYVQVLIAITIGVLVGYFYPKTGTELKPLGDAFIALIRMMIAPVIFCTVVHGIASM